MTDRYVDPTLHTLHMDLFGPTSVRSINHASYCLVITDDCSRFCWVFFLAKKDETSGILKTFIRQIENQLNHKVKIIRSDNGTEFKNRFMLEFCGEKGIKQEFSNARTPQQIGVAEEDRTLIEAARTYRCCSHLPTILWPEAVNMLLYLQQGKFDEKSDEGFLVGYSVNSKAFRVYNLVTKRVEVNLHVNFLEEKPNVQGIGHRYYLESKRVMQDQLGHGKENASLILGVEKGDARLTWGHGKGKMPVGHLPIGCNFGCIDSGFPQKVQYCVVILFTSKSTYLTISFVKQFWQTKQLRTNLQMGFKHLKANLVYEYTISDESVRRALKLADASGINMLQNEEIFVGLQNIGFNLNLIVNLAADGEGEAQVEQNPFHLRGCTNLTNVASDGFKGSHAPIGSSKIYRRKLNLNKSYKFYILTKNDESHVNMVVHFQLRLILLIYTAESMLLSTPFSSVNTAEVDTAALNTGETERVQRRKGKDPMTEEDLQAEVQASKKSKELQELADLEGSSKIAS
ncbi:putative ribonuclease H-like domain-containing protein [Tanacetum coccineum]